MGDEKTCFVISPIGGEETATRKWADQTIKHLIRPAVEPHGLEVIRADQEDRAGIITTHIIQRLVGADLVIADLTQRNPNVFYELAVRHVTRKPLAQIIRAEEEIPFDVQSMRTVKFELNDPDTLQTARSALERQVGAVLEEDQLETPISQAVGQQIAIESGDPAQVEIAELAQAVQALTAEVRGRPTASYATFGQPTGWVKNPGSVYVGGASQPIQLIDYGEVSPATKIVFPAGGGSSPTQRGRSKRRVHSSTGAPPPKTRQGRRGLARQLRALPGLLESGGEFLAEALDRDPDLLE